LHSNATKCSLLLFQCDCVRLVLLMPLMQSVRGLRITLAAAERRQQQQATGTLVSTLTGPTANTVMAAATQAL
jgi:hypothetical protein